MPLFQVGEAGGPFFLERMAPQFSPAGSVVRWTPATGGHRPPKKAPGGESFDSLSPWTPSLNDQRRGPAGPLPLETSPGCSADRKFTPTAYSVTPRGFIRFSVNVPCSCPRPAKNMVRSALGGGELNGKSKGHALFSGSGARGNTGRCEGAAGL